VGDFLRGANQDKNPCHRRNPISESAPPVTGNRTRAFTSEVRSGAESRRNLLHLLTPNLDQTFRKELFKQRQQIPFASVRLHFILFQQCRAQFLHGPRFL
jgi:hypothetical protein